MSETTRSSERAIGSSDRRSHHRRHEDGRRHESSRDKADRYQERPSDGRSHRRHRSRSRSTGRRRISSRNHSSNKLDIDNNDEFELIEAPSPKLKSDKPSATRDAWMLEDINTSENELTKDSILSAEPSFKATKESVEPVESAELAQTKFSPLDVSYEFGDSGSTWRMLKLKRVIETAREENKAVEEVALAKYGTLLEFDISREEQAELEKRRDPNYVKMYTPTGYIYEKRGFKISPAEGSSGKVVSQSELNELNAKVIKAKLMKSSKLPDLERDYKELSDLFYKQQNQNNDAVYQTAKSFLPNHKVDNRDIDPESMTIEQMLEEEKRTQNLQYDEMLSSKIMKDKSYKDELDYQDNNASRLANFVKSGKINIKDIELSQIHKLTKKLDECQLCLDNDDIDIISIGNSTFLAMTPDPELCADATIIVPINHYKNTLYCEDDEWDEIQNFMKCLARFYYSQGKGVIFYESSIYKHNHAAIVAIPLPLSLCSEAQGFFREAILAESGDWSQHKSLINTLEKSKSVGSNAIKQLIAKEAPYFHVWFTLDGGLGHIVEDLNSWPKGDLFARQVISGMLRSDPMIIKKQGKWRKNDSRIKSFNYRWGKFDWTVQSNQ